MVPRGAASLHPRLPPSYSGMPEETSCPLLSLLPHCRAALTHPSHPNRVPMDKHTWRRAACTSRRGAASQPNTSQTLGSHKQGRKKQKTACAASHSYKGRRVNVKKNSTGELTSFVIHVGYKIQQSARVAGLISAHSKRSANMSTHTPQHTYPQLGPKAKLKHTENTRGFSLLCSLAAWRDCPPAENTTKSSLPGFDAESQIPAGS